MPVRASHRGVRISPRKVRIVAGLVRGRSVADALVILDHTPRRSAASIGEVIKSARANAEHNHNLKPESLRVSGISVTSGPRFKRFRPVARGRAHPYERKTSHIFVTVDGEKRTSKKTVSKKEEKNDQ